MKYAISAATGNFGQTAVKKLVDAVGAENVVAIVRNEEKGKKLLPAGIEIRQADYGDEAAVEKALAGVDKFLFISSQPGGAVTRADQHKNVVEAAKKAGVGYVAYTSFPKASESDNWLAADHKLTEKLLKESGIKHSFLRNNWYLENDLSFLAPGPANRLYWANNFAGWALESEYAAAAVKVLTSDNPKEVYEFAGPKRSYEDLAAALNAAIMRGLWRGSATKPRWWRRWSSAAVRRRRAGWRCSRDRGAIIWKRWRRLLPSGRRAGSRHVL